MINCICWWTFLHSVHYVFQKSLLWPLTQKCFQTSAWARTITMWILTAINSSAQEIQSTQESDEHTVTHRQTPREWYPSYGEEALNTKHLKKWILMTLSTNEPLFPSLVAKLRLACTWSAHGFCSLLSFDL